MPRFDLVPEPTTDGTIVFRPVVTGPVERLRRFLRQLRQRGPGGAGQIARGARPRRTT